VGVLIPVAIASVYLHSESTKLQILTDCVDSGGWGNATVQEIDQLCADGTEEFISSGFYFLNFDILRLVFQVVHLL